MWFYDMSKVNNPLTAARQCVCIFYYVFAWAVEMHKLDFDHAKQDLANNVLAKLKEHELEPTEFEETEL